jgi:hypothetical protein
MPRLTEQDKLEEEWSIRRVATHNGLNKSAVLQVKKRWEQEGKGTVSRRPIIIFKLLSMSFLTKSQNYPFTLLKFCKIVDT